MKAAISKFVLGAAIAVLVVTGGVTPLLGQINFSPNFSSAVADSNIKLNGSAALITNNTVLQLTPATINQVGSAWFIAPQTVKGGFSTTFTFQIGGHSPDSIGDADGIAFVIQTVGTGVTGPAGCGIGFGANANCTSANGITHSAAVEFDTYNNGATDLSSSNHVAIQSCLTAANDTNVDPLNATDTTRCSIANNATLPLLANNQAHTATVTYVPPSGSTPGSMDVILDGIDLFPHASAHIDLGDLVLNDGSNCTACVAFVGFTASTGGGDDNQNILSWTFTPQAQSAPVTAGGAPAVLNFNGGPGANQAYEYDSQLDAQDGNHNPPAATVQIKPILVDVAACNKLVQANHQFGKAQCFVYQNAGKNNAGVAVDSAVLFELTCPNFNGTTSSNCGSVSAQTFAATLGSQFTFTKAENVGFGLLNATIGPYAGWLKGDGGVAGSGPCTPNGTNPLFASNQITSFSVVGDPTGKTVGRSGGGGSCWVATYFTAGELPPGINITSPAPFATYAKGSTQLASYTCSTPSTSKDPSNPANTTGPYLTVASCSQSQAPNNNTTASCSASTFTGGISCQNGVIDTSVKGLHIFLVTTKDSAGNVNAKTVVYSVK